MPAKHARAMGTRQLKGFLSCMNDDAKAHFEANPDEPYWYWTPSLRVPNPRLKPWNWTPRVTWP